MSQHLRVDDPIALRTSETNVIRNINIPSGLPDAERIVSVNARVEVTDVSLGTGYVLIEGVIRATIYYASADDPANVVSFRRNITFNDRVNISGVRPGYDVDVESIISDINFSLINNRSIELEFIVTSDIEVTAADTVPFIEERSGIEIRRRQIRIQRQVQERNFIRELEAVVRLPSSAADINRVIDIDSSIQIIDITTDYDQVLVRGSVNNDLLYTNSQGQIEYTSLSYGFNEVFPFRGVTPDMTAFVDANIVSENVKQVGSNRVEISIKTGFKILVVQEELVEIPTEVIGDISPVRRTVLVERIVVEERTRVLERDQTTIPEGNPDIGRIIRANGALRGGVSAEAQDGGVLISGVKDINIIYVADLPDQPVYFAAATVNFSSFIEIPEVQADMDAYVDAAVNRVTANRISDREIGIRAVLDVNVLVTETVRVNVITRAPGEAPTPTPPSADRFITYTIKSGDTLFKIAQRFGVSLNRLIEINNISDPANIQIGQQILIPTS